MMSGVTASRRVVVADMDKPSVDIAAELVRLEALTLFELKGEWRRLHRTTPPKRLSRDLLMRAITYKIQERRLGGLSSSILRRLECEFAWNKNPALGVICIQSGPRG